MEQNNTIIALGSLFDRVITNLSLSLYVLMIAVVSLQMAARWVLQPYFGLSLPWTVNFSQFLLVYITFIGAAVVSRKRSHISLDLLVTRLSDRGIRFLFVVRTALALLFVAVMVRGAYPLYLSNRELTIGALPTHAPFTKAWLYVPVIVGGVLVLLYGVRDLWMALTDPEAVLADLKRGGNDAE